MKTKLGARMGLYPMPVILLGSNIEGRPNYTTIAHVGIMDYDHISLSVAKIHFTNKGIEDNKTFSVNIPSTSQFKEVDYCGMVSVKKWDKAKLFTTFYGVTETAPMIEECPINMEFQLDQILDMPQHNVVIGKLVETYCDEGYIRDEEIDYAKVDPLLYVSGYWKLGPRFSDAFKPGKELKERDDQVPE